MSSNNFYFSDALDKYIDSVKQNTPLSHSDEQELRTHLLDAAEDLQKGGLTNEEAFMIAVKRLGKAELIAEEYKKVNHGFQIGNIWAYMLLGFSFISAVIWLYRMLSGHLMLYLIQHFASEPALMHIIMTLFNLLVCVGIWSILKWGASFSTWAQRIIQRKPWFTILVIFVVPAGIIFLEPLLRNSSPTFLNPDYYLGKYYHDNYYLLMENNFIVMSFYLMLISAVAVVLLSVFSIAYPGKLSFRSLFERPTIIFLLLFGFAVEVTASVSRQLTHSPLTLIVLLFGIVYAVAAFLISYYNGSKRFLYLVAFSLFGLITELWAGIDADFSRGGSMHTPYFVTALIIGILTGHLIGIKAKQPVAYND